MKFEIKNRWSGDVQFTADIDCADDAPVSLKVRLAVKWAIANLSGTDLYRADLYRADLSGVDLYRAELSGANLSGADLSRTDLSGANLYRTDLSGANLYRAELSGANLYRADLSGANLRGGIYRTDGHQFWIINTDGGPHIRAGCRWLSLPDARKHWKDTRGGTPLGDETMRILDFLEGEAKAAGWPK